MFTFKNLAAKPFFCLYEHFSSLCTHPNYHLSYKINNLYVSCYEYTTMYLHNTWNLHLKSTMAKLKNNIYKRLLVLPRTITTI